MLQTVMLKYSSTYPDAGYLDRLGLAGKHFLRPSPHLDTKSRNMCIWSCSATVAIQSLDFNSRNSDVAIQNLQVSCLPFETDNFVHVWK